MTCKNIIFCTFPPDTPANTFLIRSIDRNILSPSSVKFGRSYCQNHLHFLAFFCRLCTAHRPRLYWYGVCCNCLLFPEQFPCWILLLLWKQMDLEISCQFVMARFLHLCKFGGWSDQLFNAFLTAFVGKIMRNPSALWYSRSGWHVLEIMKTRLFF